jgi:hypothetical protein
MTSHGNVSKYLSILKRRIQITVSNIKCLVEWNDLSKSQSSDNVFALCLSNPTPVISFAREHKLLDTSPFCHLIPYYKFKPPLNIAKVHKATSSATSVKYKFGIQVPKGIKNAISLDKKNNNNLW